MDNFSYEILACLLVAGFFASFIDSVVGGGGMISLPALMWAGLPPTVALGTNKVASAMGSLTSTLSFLYSGKISFQVFKYFFFVSFVGSVAGVYVVQLISPDFLKPLVVVMLIAVTAYSVLKREWGGKTVDNSFTKKKIISGLFVILIVGFYDGFFGPGTGSFMMFFFLYIGFDFVSAAANARLLNFASNIAAVITFAYFDLVNYAYAIPMGLSMVVGALVGTRVALTKGAAYVRPLFIIVTSVLICKQLWDLLK